METKDKIKKQIESNNVLLYIKGSPQFPMCGFSAHVVNVLKKLNVKFSFVNVLENPDIRTELPNYSDWPTFPQLYIKGELVGGCDIVLEQFENGELEAMLQAAQAISDSGMQVLDLCE